jgi:hypothetical protein
LEPTNAYLKGEQRGRAGESAGWDWWSAWSNEQGAQPAISELLHVLGPHRAIFRRKVNLGVTASVSIVGEVYGVVVSSAEEAERRRYAWGDSRSEFRPFFASDRVAVFLDHEFLEFPVAVGATFDTHIDPELDDGLPFDDSD